MRWLLFLYPPAWKRRYRREVQAHLAAEPKKLRTAVDLIAGAIDAWLNPEWIPETTNGGEQTMVTAARIGSLDFSKEHAQRSAALGLIVTLALTIIGVVLDKTLGDHMAIDALIYSSFCIGLLVSARSTYLQPYSRTARNVLLVLGSLAWYGFFLAVLAIGAAT